MLVLHFPGSSQMRFVSLLRPTVGVVNGHPESPLFGAIKFDTPGPGVLVGFN